MVKVMNNEEHEKIIKELKGKYLDKLTPDNTKIVDVRVDYRKDKQYMNRVEDEYGNIYFISELRSEK